MLQSQFNLPLYILLKNFLFIYLFLAALGLCCCIWASLVVSSRGAGGTNIFVVCRFLLAEASHCGVWAHGLQ